MYLAKRPIFLLQEPHLWRGLLTSLPRNYSAHHSTDGRWCMTAIAAPNELLPQATFHMPTKHYAELSLQSCNSLVATGYCPPKDQLTPQLLDFDHIATARGYTWKLWQLMQMPITKHGDSSNLRNKTETHQRTQWRRGEHFCDGSQATKDTFLILEINPPTTRTKKYQPISDLSIWWSTTNTPLPHWRVAPHGISATIFRLRQTKPNHKIDTPHTHKTHHSHTHPDFLVSTTARTSNGIIGLDQLQARLNQLPDWSPATPQASEQAERLQTLLQHIWPPRRPNPQTHHATWWTSSLARQRKNIGKSVAKQHEPSLRHRVPSKPAPTGSQDESPPVEHTAST